MNTLDAAYNLVHDYPGGANSLAPRIGKLGTYLSAEVSGAGSAKLGLVTAVKLTQLTGDLRILNSFAAQCSCVVIPLPEVTDGGNGVMLRVAELARDFSKLIAETVEAESDSTITGNELRTIERQWSVLVAHGQGLIASLRAEHDAGQPSAV